MKPPLLAGSFIYVHVHFVHLMIKEHACSFTIDYIYRPIFISDHKQSSSVTNYAADKYSLCYQSFSALRIKRSSCILSRSWLTFNKNYTFY